MLANAVLESLAHAWTSLAPLNAPTAVMGGIGIAHWDRIRATRDVDLLVGADVDSDRRVVELLTAAGAHPIHDPPVITLDPCRLIQFSYSPPESFIDIRVDVLLADSPFHREALARRVPARIPGMDQDVAVLSCEDLIVSKLLAGRVLDRADAAALLRINRTTIEVGYLQKWVHHFALEAKWTEIWDEAFPGEKAPL